MMATAFAAFRCRGTILHNRGTCAKHILKNFRHSTTVFRIHQEGNLCKKWKYSALVSFMSKHMKWKNILWACCHAKYMSSFFWVLFLTHLPVGQYVCGSWLSFLESSINCLYDWAIRGEWIEVIVKDWEPNNIQCQLRELCFHVHSLSCLQHFLKLLN